MSTEVTIEIDDMHELMFKEINEDAEEELELEEWAEGTIETILYQSYKNQ